MKWEINICEEKCTGCRICQMICSWAHEGCFDPSRSLITVENTDKEAHFSVRFEQNCKYCGLCAAYCSSNALVKERRQRDVQIN